MKRALLAIALASLVSGLAVEPARALDTPDHQSKPWRYDESVAFAEATESARHVVVVFGAEWCLPCVKIAEIMNADIVFGLMSKSFVPLYFDLTDLSDHAEALQAKYRVPALPAVIFVDASGQELGRWKQNLSGGGLIAAMRNVVNSHPLPPQ